MNENWSRDGSRAYVDAKQPKKFIVQQIAPLFYHPSQRARGSTKKFATEEEFWSQSQSMALAAVQLEAFQITDWFPRTPGVYWSERGVRTRRDAEAHPTTDDRDLGLIFSPRSKMSLIEDGGIGNIRLRPRRIEGTDCWLATAVVGSQCAGGIPLALPHSLIAEGKVAWGDTAVIHGTVRFLQDAGLPDVAAYVHHASPVIVFVEKIESLSRRKQLKSPIIVTPVALFDHPSKAREYSRSEFGFTFVHARASANGTLEDAADWIQRYATKHGGRVITNFDERSSILADAPLSYQRLITRSYDRQIINNFHLEKLADRLDLVATTEYNNFGQVAAMGDHARAENNRMESTPPVVGKAKRRSKNNIKKSASPGRSKRKSR